MRFRRFLAGGCVLLLGVAAVGAAASPPAKSIHALDWYVHPDLEADGDTQPLSYWESLIEEATASANDILQGQNGPADVPCCTALTVGSVQFISPEDDPDDIYFDIGSSAEFNSLKSIGGGGSRAFFVDTISSCNSSNTPSLGCAETPNCVDAANNPDVILVVTLETHEAFDRLADTLAHERGHNACLAHIDFAAASECQLMTPASGGACLDDLASSQCDRYRAAANVSPAGSCDCHESVGVAAVDAAACTPETASAGLCSGGLCGETGSDAGISLVAAAGTNALVGDTTDEWISMSGATGGWSSSTPCGSGYEVRGLAYSPGRNTVYAVAPVLDPARVDPGWVTPNTLLELDPGTGDVSIVGEISGYDEIVALAFDPGAEAGPGDDRLLALAVEWNSVTPESEALYCRRLIEVDPDDASTVPSPDLDVDGNGQPPKIITQCTTDLDAGGMQGLAYDTMRSKLYASGKSSTMQVREIELPCGSTCTVGTSISTPATLFRKSPGLAYSATSDRIHLVGWGNYGAAGPRIFFDSFDANTFERAPSLAIAGFSPGGLAAVPSPYPVPEPAGGAWVVLLALAMLGRRRSLALGVSYSHLTTGGAVGEVTRAGEGCARRAGRPYGD